MKNKAFFAGFVGIMLAFGIMVIGCSNDITGGGGTTGGGGVSSGPKTVTIKYQLTGTVATVNSITYKNSTGGNDTLNNVTLPWEKSFSVTIEKGSGYTATISSSSTGSSLTAKIFVDGSEKKSVNSSGDGYFTVVAVEMVMNY